MQFRLMRFAAVFFVLWGILGAEDNRQPTPEALGKQFDAQVARLVELGYPELFGDRANFDAEMNRLREEAVRHRPSKPEYTFLIVVPEECAPRLWQIQRIRMPFIIMCSIRIASFLTIPNIAFTTNAACQLWPTLTSGEQLEIQNYGQFTTPDVPYLIYDIDEGNDTAGKWDCDVAMDLSRAHRRGLTIEECTALLIQHPALLATPQEIVAMGTVIGENGKAPDEFMYWYWSWSQAAVVPYDLRPYTWTQTRTYLNDPARTHSQGFQFPSCKE